ncbi:hypothetical protein AYM02_05730 [Coxiella burnetii]|nr:membrane protein [Coxiella burnetii]ABX77906.1 hypothetical protein COXBURSA331_A1444 [Coxiella burnetii RSA 331]AML48838.1 hypothetical protein AUR58_06365 [Coxiella burnetii]AML54801.1 hypothetical protein AYM38_05660 [Coxiella burnetii]ARK27549.1 hypothetical protein BMW92_06490 [Coxiella burnetii]ATN68767.1 hypothetical protein AYM00_05965 [Coxiella burnetii]
MYNYIYTYLEANMKASILDLRYNMKSVLKALERNEEIEILYHGKVKGTILPYRKPSSKKKITEHPFFGMLANEEKSVTEQMDTLRGGRYNDL